jgi:hypothetical protein
VANLGGQTYFADTWEGSSITDADALADAWELIQNASTNTAPLTTTTTTTDHVDQGESSLCASTAGTPTNKQLTLAGVGCGVVGVPHEARTVPVFRRIDKE